MYFWGKNRQFRLLRPRLLPLVPEERRLEVTLSTLKSERVSHEDDTWLKLPLGMANSLSLLQGNWGRLAAPLERHHGSDGVVRSKMLGP